MPGTTTARSVVQLTLVILAAGYESTASQIVSFTYARLTHPDRLACCVPARVAVRGPVALPIAW